uniref:Plasma membrane fusion protein PRM1 n=1 Tax=Salix viminalis TaxID=40686 RepID=A0A6N2KXC6_SALVM
MLCHGLLSFTLLLLTSVSHGAPVPFPSFSALPPAVVGRADGAKYEVEFSWGTRRPVVEAPIGEPVDNSPVLVLAPKRTYRKDPLNDFKRYTGGWNISDRHYWAVSLQLLCLLSLQSGSWFLGCAYSLVAFVISVAKGSALAILEQLILSPSFSLFSSAFERFHKSTTETLEYVVNQADATVDKLRAVSDFIASAKLVGVDQVFLPSNVQTDIDQIGTRINSSASVLADKTVDNSEDIKDLLDSVRVALITAAAIMLLLTFLGFLFSIFGMQFLVYILVIVGWILVAGTFILCGTFLLLHNVAGDTCVAMDHWVQNPTAHTALDDILPCVDQATTQDTLIKSKEITSQLVEVVNQVITNVSNLNFSPNFKPMYINQSGPLVPMLCNPFYADLTIRPCSAGEVELTNATQVWSSYVCQVSPTGICSTTGRLTPAFYSQMSAAVNVSYGLNNNAPFLIDLGDCTFAREIFNEIYRDHCPSLRRHSRWIYIGLVMVSTAVMLSLIFWVIYGRERRHRVYSKQLVSESAQGAEREKRS